jgi:hypothetical protein
MTVVFDTIEPNLGVLALWQPLPGFSTLHLDQEGLELGGLADHGGEGSSDAVAGGVRSGGVQCHTI